MTASHNAVARVAAGTGTLLRSFGTWLVEDGWRDLLRRLSGTAVAVAFAGMLVSGTRWLMWPGAVWFLLAAWCAAAPGAEGEEGDEEPGASVEQAPAGPPLPILPDLRIALTRVGTPHAHLAVLAEEIGTTSERVREVLEKWEIPIEAVRMRGRGSSTGVKGGPAVHPTLALRPEDAAVVAAGQPANDNNNAEGRPAEERVRVEPIGQSGFVVRDPAEAARRRSKV
ncbi:hypothetical protein [Streptomyces coffeae]|uniref:Uncharacterized protein n=1 Tax=Streptomyces coffeae TaxID=621382 RepID=A0ABS1NJ91_9ACTN|nr:hypothetical protein [Streptomyces coffeae]MBL1100130.1 hypothetical protein [Streptomyces coffeae]